ncbi:hypothetical protein BH09MYX1_BH09MYX1_67980 [soil metagenome]
MKSQSRELIFSRARHSLGVTACARRNVVAKCWTDEKPTSAAIHVVGCGGVSVGDAGILRRRADRLRQRLAGARTPASPVGDFQGSYFTV